MVVAANGKPGAAKQDRAPFGSSSGWPGLSVGQNPKAIGFDLMMNPARSGRRSFFVVGAAMGEAWTKVLQRVRMSAAVFFAEVAVLVAVTAEAGLSDIWRLLVGCQTNQRG
jgi:hypothetical protein